MTVNKKRVLIVDDDRNFRYAMNEVIPWDQYGFEVAGEAIHGKQAMEILKRTQVDVLLTDMDMPVMNGVELTRKVKELYPDILIIVLSAYDDFAFVRESMSLGAKDYILKQEFDGEKIIQMIRDLYNKQEMERNSVRRTFNKEAVLSWLKGDISELPELFQNKKEHLLFTILTVRFQDKPDISKFQRMNYLYFCEQILKQVWVFVYRLPDTNSQSEKLIFQNQVLQELKNCVARKDVICVSDSVGEAGSLPKMYRKLKDALDFCIYHPRVSVCHCLETEAKQKLRDKNYIYEFDAGNLKNSSEKDIEDNLNQLCILLMQKMPNEECLNHSLYSFFMAYFGLWTGNKKKDAYDGIRVHEAIQSFFYLEEKLDWLKQELLDKRRQTETIQYKHAEIAQAVQYIRNHYMDNISIHDIAGRVNLSDNYFSYLFKQETEESFVSFLNKTRIEHAKELLLSTNMKVYEISEAVGYQNTTYFSTIFRKLVGISVSKFKNGKNH